MRFVLIQLFLYCSVVAPAQGLERIGQLSYPSPVSLAGCAHHVDRNGTEWALVGTSKGLSIVSLADPRHPVERFFIPGAQNNWREVKTWNGYAYVSSEALASGITIVDLHALPDSVPSKKWTGDGEFAEKVQTAHTVQAFEGYLYVFGGGPLSNGAVIADLSDPWNPRITGVYNDAYVHDGFVRGDTLWTSEIYKGQFGVVDISDRSHPVLLNTQPTPAAFNHNAELSANGKTLFTTDERSGAALAAFDVSNIEDIRLLGKYRLSLRPNGEVHNVRVVAGDFLVCPSYKGQLSIVDASEPSDMVEIALDTLGASLVWDADPYLPSGLILATSKYSGLYIYKPTYKYVARLHGKVRDAQTQAVLEGAQFDLIPLNLRDTSDANGSFTISSLEQGVFTLKVSLLGYKTQWITITLENGVKTLLDISLEPAIVDLDTTLVVRPTLFSDYLECWHTSDPPAPAAPLHLALYDMSGKLVLERQIALQTSVRIEPLQYLPAGSYLLRVEDASGRSRSFKLVKI